MKYITYRVIFIVATIWGLVPAFAQTWPASGPATAPATQATTQQATLVTIHAQAQPARDVLQELARQAGATLSAPLDMWKADMPKVTVDADSRPFWEVVVAVCRQAGIIVAYTNQRNILSIDRDQPGVVLIPAGPFLGRIGSTNVVDRINYATGDLRTRQVTINMILQCEPAMRTMEHGPLKLIEAVADDGSRLTANPSPVGGVSALQADMSNLGFLNTSLQLPEIITKVRRLEMVRFSLTALLQTKLTAVEFADLSKEQIRTVEGWTLGFKQTKKANENTYQVHVVVTKIPNGMQKIHIFNNNMRLLDKDGNELQGGNFRLPGTGEITTTFYRRTAKGEPTGEPVRLIWEVPAGIANVTVPLELKNVVLVAK